MQAELGERLRDSGPRLGGCVAVGRGWEGKVRKRNREEKKNAKSVIEVMNETCFNISRGLNKYLNCFLSFFVFFSFLFLRRGGTGVSF